MTTRDDLIRWADQNGYAKDRWGHLQKTVPRGDTHRLKLSTIAVRWGIKTDSGWARVRGAYLRDVTITEQGLSGLTSYGCRGFISKKERAT